MVPPSGQPPEASAQAALRLVLEGTATELRLRRHPRLVRLPAVQDVFLFHWKDESRHTILDELEWTRVDRSLTPAESDRAVDDFIALVGAVDGILKAQAAAGVSYFQKIAEGRFDAAQAGQLADLVLRAYRWQYIVSGAQHPRFLKLLLGMITSAQADRVSKAPGPIVAGER